MEDRIEKGKDTTPEEKDLFLTDLTLVSALASHNVPYEKVIRNTTMCFRVKNNRYTSDLIKTFDAGKLYTEHKLAINTYRNIKADLATQIKRSNINDYQKKKNEFRG